MTEVDPSTLEQFIATGRTGRRNAVPDILDPAVSETSTGPLPFDMEKLNCSDDTSESSKSDTACAPKDPTSTNTASASASTSSTTQDSSASADSTGDGQRQSSAS